MDHPDFHLYEEAFQRRGDTAWRYRICLAHAGRKLYVAKDFTVADAGGWWWEKRAIEFLQHARSELFAHLRERAEKYGPEKMTPQPPRRLWLPDDAVERPPFERAH